MNGPAIRFNSCHFIFLVQCHSTESCTGFWILLPVYVIRVFRLSCRIWKTCPAGGLQPRLFSPMFHVPGFFSALPIASCTRTVPSSPGMTDTAVIVFSRAGNTRKVADAIAAEPGVPVQDTNAPLPESARLVFPGSGGYGGKPGEPLMQFIGSGNFSGRKAALSGTSGGAEGAQHMIAVMGMPSLRRVQRSSAALRAAGSSSLPTGGIPAHRTSQMRRRLPGRWPGQRENLSTGFLPLLLRPGAITGCSPRIRAGCDEGE